MPGRSGTRLPRRGRSRSSRSIHLRAFLLKIADDQRLGNQWWVRLDVVWKPDPQIEVNIEKTPPGPHDFVVESRGLLVVVSDNQKAFLKGAQVTLVGDGGLAAFDVTFPNRDESDRKLAAEWLQKEKAKRAKSEVAK